MNRRNFFSMLCGVLMAPFIRRPDFSVATCGMFGPLKLGNLVPAPAGELARVLNAPALVTVHVGGRIECGAEGLAGLIRRKFKAAVGAA